MGNKTKVGLLLVAALIFVIAAPAFAASPVAEEATVTDASGAAVEVTTSTDVPEEIQKSAEEALGVTSTQKLQVVDIVVSGGTPPYRIAIPAASATAGRIYHFVDGKWEALPTTVENGEIVAWTNSASPFAVVYTDVEGATVTVPAGITEADVVIPDTSSTPTGTWITLPAGATYYTMVEGQPGAAHTLDKATQVQVIERLGNGYTKILMGTTTYLIKTSGGAVASTTGKSPKTGAESDMSMILLIAGAALATIAVVAGKKAYKVQD